MRAFDFFLHRNFLVADDQTRVVLKNASSGDYINASYVNVSCCFSFSSSFFFFCLLFIKLSSEAMTTYYFHSCTCVRADVRHAPVSQKRLKIFE
jgi:hypothetical protein